MIVFCPSDCARANRKWQRSLSMPTFPRLFEAVGKLNEAVSVQLEFALDENDRVRVFGQIATKAKLRCHACSLEKEVPFTVNLDVRLVRSEREAREIFGEFDAIVVSDDKITLQELIEDDVLMSIPSRVCDDQLACPRRHTATEAIPPTTHRPFANIGRLMKASRS